MTQRQRDLLQQLDDTIDQALEAFRAGLSAVAERLMESVRELIASLRKRSDGRVFGNGYNYERIRAYSKGFGKILDAAGYTALVRGLVGSYNAVAGVVDEYVRTLSPSYARRQLYKEILRANVETTVQGLLASGIDANLKEPIVKILKLNLAGGTEARALVNVLKSEIIGSGEKLGRLERYAAQITQDAVEQFGRNYIEGVSADLGLKHYLYAGTRIEDTRSFCCARAGRYFTEEEVRGWGSLKWAGQIPGTNSSNILTFLGGYSCRHRLLPVSEELYEREKAKGKAGVITC